jgi:hypothetical protein
MGLIERIRTHSRARWTVAALYTLAVAAVLVLVIRQPDPSAKEPPPGPLRGKEAPKLADEIEFWIQGDELEFEDVRGQPILLVFWHPRDGLAAMAMARITELIAPFESRGLVVVGVTLFTESPDPLDPETLVAAAEEETRKVGIPFRVGLDCDGSAHELYGIERTGTPFCFLINTARICVWEGPPDRLNAGILAKELHEGR